MTLLPVAARKREPARLTGSSHGVDDRHIPLPTVLCRHRGQAIVDILFYARHGCDLLHSRAEQALVLTRDSRTSSGIHPSRRSNVIF